MSLRHTAVALAIMAACNVASAFDMVDDTYLIELNQGGVLSSKASSLGDNGYESQTGERISLLNMYHATWTDARITFLTSVNKEFGIIWGFSTGEHARKYSISPSIKLGAVYIHKINETSSLTLKGSFIFGGNLREKACTADYGDIGGVQSVNCRLAASELEPSATLQYLINEKARDYRVISIQYNKSF